MNFQNSILTNKEYNSDLWSEIFPALASSYSLHAPGSEIYSLLDKLTSNMAQSTFGNFGSQRFQSNDIGELLLPYFKMGAIDSTNLFGLDELIIFSYYHKNRKNYSVVADIGANIGLHSIVMAKCGFTVHSFEPDPIHFNELKKNLELNCVKEKISLNQTAISSKSGKMNFTRVLGNTTGSHLTGSRDSPYGPLEQFKVQVEALPKIMKYVDLMKIDIEGQEAIAIKSTNSSHWDSTDAIIEVSSIKNADLIYNHLKSINVNMFAQKINWGKATSTKDLPKSYKEGSLFISKKAQMLWTN